MKIEVHQDLSKEAVARLLVDSAKSIMELGKINIQGKSFSLPEILETEIEFKEKNGRAKFEIEIKWPVGKLQIREGLLKRQISAKHKLNLQTAKEKGAISSASLKGIKKSMGDLLKRMKEKVKSGKLPTTNEAESFLELAKQFLSWKNQNPEWGIGLKELEAHSQALVAKINKQDYSAVNSELARLSEIKQRYHKQFKD
jgi:XXXCH domain-containing protein